MRRIVSGTHTADECSNVGRVPFSGPDKPRDLTSLAVDQQGRGKANRTQLTQRLGRTVEIHCEFLDSDLGEKLAHHIRAAINRQCHHLEVSSSQPGLYPVSG